jgi:site-specific DNA-methyltransferase (adenine-specific)
MKLELNTIYCGDCVEILKRNRDFCPNLIFADPPFNIGYEYSTYQDKIEYKDYVNWTHSWIGACYEVLADDGSFYIAIGDEYAAEVKMFARQIGLETRNWIIWNYGFGQNTVKKFGRSHTHIFYFVKNPKKFTFNDMEIRVPSARQLIYNDKRSDPRGRIPDDIWKYPRVCGTFKERVGWHTCQMPLKLMTRIIKASSNPGDLVMDPFSGSASTLVVAALLGRNYIGFDIDPKYVELGQQRINEMLKTGIYDIDEKEESGSVARPEKNKTQTASLFGA